MQRRCCRLHLTFLVLASFVVGPMAFSRQPIARAQQPEPLPPYGAPLASPAPLQPVPIAEVPPGTPAFTLADLEQIALSNNPSLARAMAMVSERRGNTHNDQAGPRQRTNPK
jgi:outer membrane protein TolC